MKKLRRFAPPAYGAAVALTGMNASAKAAGIVATVGALVVGALFWLVREPGKDTDSSS
jgi:hypothetical protein